MGGQHTRLRTLVVGMLADARYIGFFSSSGYSPDIQGRSYGEEDDEDGRTEIIYAVSEIGSITDFIKTHTMYTVDDYKWNLNPRFIRIMSVDNTRVHYLSEKEAKRRKDKYVDGTNLNDLGMPIFGNGNDNK